MPFVQEEIQGIRRVASYCLRGYKLKDLTQKENVYLTLFKGFQLASGLEYGDVHFLPCSGGTLNQPYKTLEVWNIFREELLKHIASEQKKQSAKMKSRR